MRACWTNERRQGRSSAAQRDRDADASLYALDSSICGAERARVSTQAHPLRCVPVARRMRAPAAADVAAGSTRERF